MKIESGGYATGYIPLLKRFNGAFSDDFKCATLEMLFSDDDRNTLMEIKLEFLEDDAVKAISKRKLYTSTGWITTEIESVYKRNLRN